MTRTWPGPTSAAGATIRESGNEVPDGRNRQGALKEIAEARREKAVNESKEAKERLVPLRHFREALDTAIGGRRAGVGVVISTRARSLLGMIWKLAAQANALAARA